MCQAEDRILEEMCEEGYFGEGRPRDEAAYLLEHCDLDALNEERRRLYEERLHPLMRVWLFERERFGEY